MSRLDFKVDPAIKGVLPPLTPEERSLLEKDLLANGCLDSLIVWQNILLDGHHRFEICQKHNIAFATKQISLKSKIDAFRWIVEHQDGRRNWNHYAKAKAVLVYKQEIAKLAKNKQKQSGGAVPQKSVKPPIDTQKELARIAKVSHDTIAKVEKIEKKATPEQKSKLATGEESIHRVHSQIKQAEKEEKKKAKNQQKEKIPHGLPDISDRYQILHASIEDAWKKDFREIQSSSIDWIITDPPYSEESLALYEDLGIFARRVLKNSGSLICMTGQSYLPTIFSILSTHLQYHWMLSYLTPGGQSAQLWQKKVNTFWKPLLWFVKGKYNGDWIGDVVKSEVNDNDKRFHKWGQSESGMADIITRFTMPGETICDPFLGGGTTGIVALKMNRRFVGIDNDRNAIETTKKRIQTLCQKTR